MDVPGKPKLLFFQYKYDGRLPAFLLNHKREHVQCLSQFFDVIIVNDDCDYRQVCEQHEPALALFESGVNHSTCQRPLIRNARACPEVPKLGLHHADGFCNARAGFISDMEHWGIEAFFAISTTAAEHTPEIADRLFVWPNFIDPDIYRDYGAWKSIPVLFTGNTNSLYPWRQSIIKQVAALYPSLLCPHPGYHPRATAAPVMVGERYARTINASWFVPACGTVAKEVVRKHFEVPASRSCLVTERSPGLEAAGFVDMKNCVFADEHDVVDKLAHLFRNQDELEAIIEAGHRLVHSRHTIRHRDQIYRWFLLQRDLKADEKIVQLNPFEPPLVVNKSFGPPSVHVMANGLHLSLLRRGDEALSAGRYVEAEGFYLRCMGYMRWMPEPKLRLTLCNLYLGRPQRALSCVLEPIEFILSQYKAIDPDPVEWAYYVVALLCLGELGAASERAERFPWLRHPELDRARWAVAFLKGGGGAGEAPRDGGPRRRSLHQLPVRSFQGWIDELSTMLRACGQADMATALTSGARAVHVPAGATDAARSTPNHEAREGCLDEARARNEARALFRWRSLRRSLLARLKRGVGAALHGLERRIGYFLPYRVSEMREDEFLAAVRSLLREEAVRTVLVIGATVGAGSTEAVLAGAHENRSEPMVFCIGRSGRRWARRPKVSRGRPNVKWYERAASPPGDSQGLARALREIREENHTDSFDVVLIDSARAGLHSCTGPELDREIRGARFVMFDGTGVLESYHRLLTDPNYVLISHDGRGNGRSMFGRKSGLEAPPRDLPDSTEHAPGERPRQPSPPA